MELPLAFVAGLLTLINPCVLPVLPVVLAAALQAGRAGPLALAGGMALSFVALGLFVAAAGQAFGLTEETVSAAGAVLMAGFGLVLLVPRFSAGFALAAGGVSAGADAGIGRLEGRGLAGQFLGGLLLGAVWSPCIGPTLGGAIALASSGGNLWRAGAVMVAFALGVAVLMLALAYGAQSAIRARRGWMRRLAGVSRPAMGTVFVAVGLAVLTGFTHRIEGWVLQHLPYWLTDFSVSI